MSALLDVILPVFLLIGFGYAAARAGVEDSAAVAVAIGGGDGLGVECSLGCQRSCGCQRVNATGSNTDNAVFRF